MSFPVPTEGAAAAAQAEEDGFDGLLFTDSQGLAGDPYVALALAARDTDRLQLGTGVTNPYTRHPAVTAAAIASVQAESGGRAVLGIGRGNSALAFLGLAPAPLDVFDRYLGRLQSYLRGETADADQPAGPMRPVADLNLGHPPDSRLQWLPRPEPKVPLDVAATGPKVIGLAVRRAERITFSVGADPERLAWALTQAYQAAADAGVDPAGVSYGAYVNVAVDPDRPTARSLVGGSLTVFARYAALHGTPIGPLSPSSQAVLERIRSSYDMARHAQAGTDQTAVLTDDFIDRHAVVGSPADCARRLEELFDLGLQRIVLFHGSLGADAALTAASRARLVGEVLPALRRGAPPQPRADRSAQPSALR